MGRKRSKYYISTKEFIKELKYYNKNDIISEKLGKMLLRLAKRYACKGNFSGYSYREEFVSDAVLRMIEQLDKINLDHPRCNPFAYLTQTCKNCFRARINKETKYNDTKENLKEKVFNEIKQIENIDFKKNDEDEL